VSSPFKKLEAPEQERPVMQPQPKAGGLEAPYRVQVHIGKLKKLDSDVGRP
jgi:hypothetical protein